MRIRMQRIVEAWYCRRIWDRSDWYSWACDVVLGR